MASRTSCPAARACARSARHARRGLKRRRPCSSCHHAVRRLASKSLVMPNGRISQNESTSASAKADSADTMPTEMMLPRAAETNWPKLCTGLPSVTTPTISPFQRIGAPTYITLLCLSAATSRVVRAPYSPRSVLRTSCQPE